MKTRFVKETFYSAPPEALFAFHERPDAFEKLLPPDTKIEIVSSASTLRPSEERVRFVVPFSFLKFAFEMQHTQYEKNRLFVDQQVKGLFSSWRHEHHFIPGGWIDQPATLLSDRIELSHPLLFAFRPFVVRRLKKIFEYRHRLIGQALGTTPTGGGAAGRSVIVTGATGLIGSRIVRILIEQGARVIVFARNVEATRRIFGEQVKYATWDFDRPADDAWKKFVPQADALLHLAGTPLFARRWSKEFKRKMEQSRVLGTRQLVEAVAESQPRPRAFVSASAVGIYGLETHLTADENTKAADDLLARICVGWEDEARKVAAAGVRDVQIRIGIVLSKRAGALKAMLPLFRLGLGGWLGRPDGWINWIHLEDIARIFVMALCNDSMQGAYNAAAPRPISMREFAADLARVLRRPNFMRYPVSLIKPFIGQAADFASGGARADCRRIQQAGYRFFFEHLDAALENSLRATKMESKTQPV
jgi:uncharacterized protein